MTDQDLTGRTAVITGGGFGIGAAVALWLGAAGANVMVSNIRLDAAQKVADRIIAAGGSAAVQVCDTAVDVQVQELAPIATRTGMSDDARSSLVALHPGACSAPRTTSPSCAWSCSPTRRPSSAAAS